MLLSRDNTSLYLVPLSVDFIQRYGLYLIDVTTNPVKILAILEYMKDTLTVVQTEMKAMSAANREFLTSLSGAIELEQNTGHENSKFPAYKPTEKPKIEQTALRAESALLDSLLNGIPNHAIEYWLKDILKEKGIKKWRKICFSAYDNVRKVLFENLLPACERILILLIELRGLSKWGERGGPLGLDQDLIEVCVGQAVSMSEMANNLMWSLNTQLQLFRYFSIWIEILFEEVTEIPLKDPSQDSQGPKYTISSKVVEYITKHIGASMNLPQELDIEQPSASLSLKYDSLAEACHNFLDKVKSKMLEHVYSTDALRLIESTDAHVEIHLAETTNENAYCYIAICEANQLEVLFARFKLSGTDPISAVEMSRVDVSAGPGYSRMQKIQFIDDQDVVVLLSTEDAEKPRNMLMSLSYSELLYTVVPYESGKSLAVLGKDAAKVPLELKKSREFGEEFVPEQVSINQHRHVGCLLEKDHQQFILFDNNEDDYNEEDEDDKENE